ncbi:cell wall-active antibiotics response protein LiaF [candidate division KSB1 bacterium]
MKENRSLVIGVILIAAGFIVILEKIFDIGIFSIIFNLWPLLLILVGWQIIKRAKDSSKRSAENTTGEKYPGHEGVETDSLNQSSFIGDISTRVFSKNFTGGNVSGFIGNIHLNLSEIDVTEGEKTVNVSGIIGDINITVPKDFAYRIRGNSIVGDIHILGEKTGGIFRHLSFRSDGYSEAEKQLNINVSLVIGDIHIA